MNTAINLQELQPYIRSNSDNRVFIDGPRFDLNMNSSISEEEIKYQMETYSNWYDHRKSHIRVLSNILKLMNRRRVIKKLKLYMNVYLNITSVYMDTLEKTYKPDGVGYYRILNNYK